MNHPESKTTETLLLEQCLDLYEESIVVAERILRAALTRAGLSGDALEEGVRDGLLPLAIELRGQASGLASAADSINRAQLDRGYDAAQRMLEALRQRNAEAKT